jgi:cytochrome c
MRMTASLAMAALLVSSAAQADGDAVAGKKVFNKCMSCHDAKTDKNKIGPSLLGVVGRKAGTLESFAGKFSDNIKEAGAGGLVWDDANLTAYLRDPKAVIPKGKMAFPGLKSDEDLANVIAYLKADPKP